MRLKFSLVLTACLALVLSGRAWSQQAPTTRSAATQPAVTGFARWEKEISAYEQADKTNPPPRGGIVFTG